MPIIIKVSFKCFVLILKNKKAIILTASKQRIMAWPKVMIIFTTSNLEFKVGENNIIYAKLNEWGYETIRKMSESENGDQIHDSG